MTSNNNDGKPSHDPSSNDPERNPFVAFRRFVDDEFASIFSAFGSLKPHFQKSMEELEKEHQLSWQRFTKNYERATNPERTRIQPRSGEEEDRQISQQQSQEVTCPFMDEIREEQSQAHASTTRRPHNQTIMMPPFPLSLAFDHSSFPTAHFQFSEWEPDVSDGTYRPNAYFLALSPYSPRRLEADDPTRQGGDRWRRAFVDLLHTAEGEDTDFRRTKTMGSRGPITSWIEELQEQGLASRSIDARAVMDEESMARPAVDEFSAPTQGSRGENERSSKTELDVYEHFLGGHLRPQAQAPTKQTDKPRIISTSNTTERWRQSDGTVTCKTIVKTTFADGTEETEEKTDTTHGPPPPQKRVQPEQEPRRTPIKDAIEEKQKPGGSWLPGFWSSS